MRLSSKICVRINETSMSIRLLLRRDIKENVMHETLILCRSPALLFVPYFTHLSFNFEPIINRYVLTIVRDSTCKLNGCIMWDTFNERHVIIVQRRELEKKKQKQKQKTKKKKTNKLSCVRPLYASCRKIKIFKRQNVTRGWLRKLRLFINRKSAMHRSGGDDFISSSNNWPLFGLCVRSVSSRNDRNIRLDLLQSARSNRSEETVSFARARARKTVHFFSQYFDSARAVRERWNIIYSKRLSSIATGFGRIMVKRPRKD